MKHLITFSFIMLGLSATIGRAVDPLTVEGKSGRVREWPVLAWKKASPSPFARVESPTAVVEGKLYMFGGFTDDLQASNQLDVYEPASDTWTRLKDMPARLTHLNPAIDGGTIWIAGGFKGKHPGPVTDEVWKYSVGSDTWDAGPKLPETRAGGGLAIVGRRLHYFGGYKADRDSNAGDHWSLSLDGGTDWRREADLPDPRGHVSAAVLDGKIYALGGDHGHDVTQLDVASCHRFDPVTGKWSEIAALPDARSHFESSTIVHGGRIVILGGRCNAARPPRNVEGDILEYDPKADRWIVVGELPEKVLAPSAAFVAGRFVVVGGGLNNPRPLTAATHVATLPAAKVERGLLEGTWEHKFPDAPQHRQVKIINQTHFVWVTFVREGGEPLLLGGGTYTYDGKTYKEKYEFGGPGLPAELVGKEQTFAAILDGDKWTHTGTLSNGFNVKETWSKLR